MREALDALTLALAALLAYLPCLRGSLLWDDDAHVIGIPMQGFDGLIRIWTQPGATQQYYPILYSAFWLEHRVWGDSVLGYHLINVLFHAGGAYLLTRILRFLDVRGAWLAGFVFALHPVCTEAVAWISEQKSTLSGVFYFGAALYYLHFDRSRKRSSYLIGLLLFILALLSKTVTATLPAALLLIFWWRRGEIRWKRDVLPLIPWLLTGVAAGIGTAWVEKTFVGANGVDFALTFAQRVLLAGRVLWFYAAKVVWPENLTFIYPHWTVDTRIWWQYAFTLFFLGLLAGLGLWARGATGSKRRAPLVSALFFAGTLFPALGFFDVYPFRYSWVADHFQYLACLGIIVPVAWLLSGVERRAGTAMAAILVTGLGALTWRQAHMYADPITLYQTTLERNPSCWMAHNNLGFVLSKIPARQFEAMSHLRAALQLNPNQSEEHNNVALILVTMPGRRDEAIDEFRTALRIKPDYPEAHFNLANQYYKLPDHLSEAVAEYRAALRARPNFPEALANLGAILARDPAHTEEGLADLRAAAKADPRFLPTRITLANTLAEIPQHGMEAQLEYEEIIQRAPRLVAARINLGYLLLKNSDGLEDALTQFRTAVAIAPQSPEAHVGMAMALSRIPGMADEAKRHLQTALKLKPDLAIPRQLSGVPSELPASPPKSGKSDQR